MLKLGHTTLSTISGAVSLASTGTDAGGAPCGRSAYLEQVVESVLQAFLAVDRRPPDGSPARLQRHHARVGAVMVVQPPRTATRGTALGVCGAWCVVRGAWCVVRCAWCVVRGAWCVVRGAWCVVRGAWCVVRGAWCVVWCVVCGVWCGVWGVTCGDCGVWCGAWGVWWVVWGEL